MWRNRDACFPPDGSLAKLRLEIFNSATLSSASSSINFNYVKFLLALYNFKTLDYLYAFNCQPTHNRHFSSPYKIFTLNFQVTVHCDKFL